MSRFSQTFRLSRAALIVGFYGAVTACSTLWSLAQQRRSPVLSQLRIPLVHLIAHSVGSVLLGAAVGLFFVMLTRMLQERYASVRFLHKQFHQLLASLRSYEIGLLAFCSAVGEETLFRGALFDFVASKSSGNLGSYLAVLVSSALFTLLHIGPHKRFLSWTASSFVVGILLALLRIFTSDLLAPIVAHFVLNMLNLRDIVQRRQP